MRRKKNRKSSGEFLERRFIRAMIELARASLVPLEERVLTRSPRVEIDDLRCELVLTSRFALRRLASLSLGSARSLPRVQTKTISFFREDNL